MYRAFPIRHRQVPKPLLLEPLSLGRRPRILPSERGIPCQSTPAATGHWSFGARSLVERLMMIAWKGALAASVTFSAQNGKWLVQGRRGVGGGSRCEYLGLPPPPPIPPYFFRHLELTCAYGHELSVMFLFFQTLSLKQAWIKP